VPSGVEATALNELIVESVTLEIEPA
jgi:hypothetical protein